MRGKEDVYLFESLVKVLADIEEAVLYIRIQIEGAVITGAFHLSSEIGDHRGRDSLVAFALEDERGRQTGTDKIHWRNGFVICACVLGATGSRTHAQDRIEKHHDVGVG